MFAARCLCAVLLLAVVAPVRAALPEFTQLVKDVGPAVVNISTTQKARQQEMFPGFPMDPDDPRSEHTTSMTRARGPKNRNPPWHGDRIVA